MHESAGDLVDKVKLSLEVRDDRPAKQASQHDSKHETRRLVSTEWASAHSAVQQAQNGSSVQRNAVELI